MKLSIIIVSFNVRSYLRKCLESIYQSSIAQDIQIIVVDNYSFDKTCDMITDEYPKVQLIRNQMNMGFSKAVNIGEFHAKGDYLCILNPDTLVSEYTFNTLITYIENFPHVGCIGPKVLNSDGTFQLSCRRSFPHPMTAFFKFTGLSRIFPKSRLFGRYNLTYQDENDIQKVDALSGSFMLMPREIFQIVGKFDESFFMYGEDLDYCYRIQKSGYDLVYNPQVSIVHHKGESVKSAPFDMVDIFYSAMNIFYLKHIDNFPSWKFVRPFVFFGIYLHKMSAYLTNYNTRFIAWLIDTACMSLCFAISFMIWYPFYYGEIVTINIILNHWPLLIDLYFSWIISSYWLNLYTKDILSYSRSMITAVMAFLLSATSTYFIGIIAYSRMILLLTLIMTIIASASWRMLLHLLYRYKGNKLPLSAALFSRRAVIIGTDDESMRIGNLLNNSSGYNFNLIGYIDDDNISCTEQFIGRLDDIRGLVMNFHINEIIIPESWANIHKYIYFLHNLKDLNINCKLVPENQNTLIGKGMVENLSGVPLMDMQFPLFDKFQQIAKRMFDIFLSSLLIILSMPLHIYYLLGRKVQDHNYWSIDGQNIHVYHYDSKEKIIQELPLLFMVLTGSMSFVGTQLIDITHQDPGLIIKPGLIGLQHLQSSDINSDSIRDYEQYYAMHFSLIFDIQVILKTILHL